MKEFNTKRSRTFIAVLIFVLCLSVNSAIYLRIADLNGPAGYQKLSIQLRAGEKPDKGLNTANTKLIEGLLQPDYITYFKIDRESVSSGDLNSMAQIYGIKGDYNKFYNIKLKRGTFLRDQDDIEERNVAVIDESLANKLYRNDNIVGLELYVSGRKFKVIGVLAQEQSIFADWLDNSLPKLYIPLSTLNQLKSSGYISNIELKPTDSSIAKAKIREVFNIVELEYGNFTVKDSNVQGLVLSQRYKLPVFILAVFCIYKLAIVIYRMLLRMRGCLQSELKKNYFVDALKACRISLFGDFALTLGCVILAAMLWKLSAFSLYISPESFPKDPTSLSEISSILKNAVKGFLASGDSYPISHQRQIDFLNKLGILVLMCNLVFAGILLSSLHKNLGNAVNKLQYIRVITSYYIAALMISNVIVYLMGMPVGLPAKEVLLIWLELMLIIALHKNKLAASAINTSLADIEAS